MVVRRYILRLVTLFQVQVAEYRHPHSCPRIRCHRIFEFFVMVETTNKYSSPYLLEEDQNTLGLIRIRR